MNGAKITSVLLSSPLDRAILFNRLHNKLALFLHDSIQLKSAMTRRKYESYPFAWTSLLIPVFD